MRWMDKGWLTWWRPDAYYNALGEAPLAAYYAAGYRLLLLDIDNTLMTHGHSSSDPAAGQALSRIRSTGLMPVILSNAKRERAAAVAADLGCPVIGMAMKPGVGGIEAALRLTGFGREQTLLAGDQLFTDIWAARKAGVAALLVRPISRRGEPIQIRFKRRLEDWLFRRYNCRPVYDEIRSAGIGAPERSGRTE